MLLPEILEELRKASGKGSPAVLYPQQSDVLLAFVKEANDTKSVAGNKKIEYMKAIEKSNAANRELKLKIAQLSQFCQANDIDKWGDSCVSAVMEYVKALEIQIGQFKSVLELQAEPIHSASSADFITGWQQALKPLEDTYLAPPSQLVRDVQAQSGRAGFIAGAEYLSHLVYAGQATDGYKLVVDEYEQSVKHGVPFEPLLYC